MKINPMTDRISIEASASIFQSDLANADSTRAAALSRLQQLLAARANHSDREQTRLAHGGSAGDPVVLELQTQVARDRQLARLLAVEVDRVNARVPVIAKDGWAVYGFVWNAQWEGQPNLTVAIYDVSGTWMRQFGYARTDNKGYFALPSKSTAVQTNIAGETSRSSVALSLVMHVINQSRTTLFIDKTPLTLTPGTVEYRPIILDTTSPSGPPRGGINETGPIVAASAKAAATQKPRSTKKSKKKGR
jgi:hypothetical protein